MIKKWLIRVREIAYDVFLHHWYYHLSHYKSLKYVVLGESVVGIGNRIIALANTYSWHGKDNIKLLWACDAWMGVPFDELFVMSDAPGFESTSFKRRNWSRYVQVPMFVFSTSKWWQFWLPSQFAEQLPNRNIFCMYDDIPEIVRSVFKPFFLQLMPSEKVSKRIVDLLLPDNVVCVQIRNSFYKMDAPGVASIETFIKVMKKYDNNQKFFLSCMHKEISEQVKAIFGDRIMELPNKDYTSMVDAVADMWLLGAGKEMICQKGSTFAEVAWWWHGCKPRVNAIEREYFQNR